MSLLKTIADAVFPGAGGHAGVAAIVTQNPKLMQAIMALLSKDSPIGGLPGLVARFDNVGLGDTVATWLGSGPNTPVSPADIQHALGGNVIDQLAAQAEMTPTEASNALSLALPAMIDKITPKGNADAMDLSAIHSMLGDFLEGRL